MQCLSYSKNCIGKWKSSYKMWKETKKVNIRLFHHGNRRHVHHDLLKLELTVCINSRITFLSHVIFGTRISTQNFKLLKTSIYKCYFWNDFNLSYLLLALRSLHCHPVPQIHRRLKKNWELKHKLFDGMDGKRGRKDGLIVLAVFCITKANNAINVRGVEMKDSDSSWWGHSAHLLGKSWRITPSSERTA